MSKCPNENSLCACTGECRKSKDTEILDSLLQDLNTLGVSVVPKKAIYNYVMGDTKALDEFKGDVND